MDRNKQIVVLVAVLLAIIAVSVVLLWLLPSRSEPAAAPVPATEFDVRVLQRPEYLQLDTQPVKDGSLPVQPPAPVGKANPFL